MKCHTDRVEETNLGV